MTPSEGRRSHLKIIYYSQVAEIPLEKGITANLWHRISDMGWVISRPLCHTPGTKITDGQQLHHTTAHFLLISVAAVTHLGVKFSREVSGTSL